MRDRATAAPRWRLFVAAPLPAEAANQLWAALEPVRQRHASARWARREQLHATLVFLGQTAATEVPRIESSMAMVGALHGPFEANTAEAGGRINDRRGGVAWLRVDEGARQLRDLSLELDRLMGTHLYAGGAPRPHVTVARRIDEPMLADLRQHAADLNTRWPVDRVGLYRSHPDAGGSRYEQLAEELLRGQAS